MSNEDKIIRMAYVLWTIALYRDEFVEAGPQIAHHELNMSDLQRLYDWATAQHERAADRDNDGDPTRGEKPWKGL